MNEDQIKEIIIAMINKGTINRVNEDAANAIVNIHNILKVGLK